MDSNLETWAAVVDKPESLEDILIKYKKRTRALTCVAESKDPTGDSESPNQDQE